MAVGANKEEVSEGFDLFDNISLEEAEDIFKDLQSPEDGDEDEKPKIAKSTAATRRRALKAWNK